ncbi:hypothetical protein MAHJHV53_04680 [Mycobacterium avium subsp. hominissuis]|nr:hypothetical protein MAH_0793 [Mycobacterium avium subsp. hominissuis TH135]
MASADIANNPPTACIGLEPRPKEIPADQRSGPDCLTAIGPSSSLHYETGSLVLAHALRYVELDIIAEMLSEQPHPGVGRRRHSRGQPHASPPFCHVRKRPAIVTHALPVRSKKAHNRYRMREHFGQLHS